MKRFIAMMIVIIMFIAMMSTSVFADSAGSETIATGRCGDNAEWSLYNDGTFVVYGIGEMYDYYLDWDVSAVPRSDVPWEKYMGNITRIKINDGITYVGANAFWGCELLTELSLANSVETIGYSAFESNSLRTFIIPNGTKAIGDFAFLDSLNLEYVQLPESLEYIGGGAFKYARQLKEIHIPQNVNYIGGSAFHENLESIYFYGDVPEECGDNLYKWWAFPDSATVFFQQGKDGWTSPTWKDDNGFTYNTASFEAQKLDSSSAPVWEESRINIESDITQVYLYYNVDSSAQYVRLDYEGYTAAGEMYESETIGIYEVVKKLFAPVDKAYPYTVIKFGDVDGGLVGFSEGTISKLYLTVCDASGNSLSDRSAAYEVYCAISEDSPDFHHFDNDSNGYCDECNDWLGSSTDCQHSNTSTLNKSYYGDEQYLIADDTMHKIVRYYNLVCPHCNETVASGKRDESYEYHKLDKQSKCSSCPYDAAQNPYPTLTGFAVSSSSVKLGESISVQGFIDGNGAKLAGIAVAVRNVANESQGGYWIHATNLYADSYDLSSVDPLTLAGTIGNTSFGEGTWIVEVYANTEHGLGFECRHTQTIVIASSECQHDYGYDYADVSKGEWQKVDEYTHKRVTVLYKDVCIHCGNVRYERRADEGAVVESHTWGKTNWQPYKQSNESEHYRTGMTSCTASGCTATKNVVETGVHEFVDGECICGKKTTSWQAAWNHVDQNMPVIEIMLDSDPLYLFEAFVEEYRDDTCVQAWTAALSGIDIAMATLPEALKVIEGNTEDLMTLFRSDEKVARLIIDYLATTDFSAVFNSVDNVDTLTKIYGYVGDGLDLFQVEVITCDQLRNIKVYSTVNGKQYKLGDLMNISEENFEEVFRNLKSIQMNDGTVDFFDLKVLENTYIDTPGKLGNKVRTKLEDSIIEEIGDDTSIGVMDDTIGKKVLTGLDVVEYLLQPIFSSIDAYKEFAKYQAVLDQYESDLMAIAEASGNSNAKRMVEKVMETLTDTVADGIALSIEKEILADVAANAIGMAIEETIENVFVRAAGIVVNVENMILSLVANISETFGKVWSVEDLYEEFQTAEKKLLGAVKKFHSSPSDETYEQMEAALAYYSLLVGTGADAISSILINDAEAVLNKFKNWLEGLLDDTDVDYRIQQIEYAKEIPASDQKTLDGVKQRIIP